jgi:hypothetical protein
LATKPLFFSPLCSGIIQNALFSFFYESLFSFTQPEIPEAPEPMLVMAIAFSNRQLVV